MQLVASQIKKEAIHFVDLNARKVIETPRKRIEAEDPTRKKLHNSFGKVPKYLIDRQEQV